MDLLADSAGLADAGTLSDYENSTYRSRLMALVREFVGVSDDGRAVRRAAVRAGVEAARVRDEIADIINAVDRGSDPPALRVAGVRHAAEDRQHRPRRGEPRLPPAGLRGPGAGNRGTA